MLQFYSENVRRTRQASIHHHMLHLIKLPSMRTRMSPLPWSNVFNPVKFSPLVSLSKSLSPITILSLESANSSHNMRFPSLGLPGGTGHSAIWLALASAKANSIRNPELLQSECHTGGKGRSREQPFQTLADYLINRSLTSIASWLNNRTYSTTQADQRLHTEFYLSVINQIHEQFLSLTERHRKGVRRQLDIHGGASKSLLAHLCGLTT